MKVAMKRTNGNADNKQSNISKNLSSLQICKNKSKDIFLMLL